MPEAEATDFSRALGRPNSAAVPTGLQKPLLFIYLFFFFFLSWLHKSSENP